MQQQKTQIQRQFYTLIIYLRLLNLGYHHTHVHSHGANYFSDHKLFEHLYQSIASLDEIDKVYEKFKGLLPSVIISLPETILGVQTIMDENFKSSVLNKQIKVRDAFQTISDVAVIAEVLLSVENGLQEHITDMVKTCEKENIDGLVNMLQDIADKHQEAIYHLGQRLSDVIRD